MIAEGKPFKGFILDFDYSSFWMDVQAKKNLVPAIVGAVLEARKRYGDRLFEEGDSARMKMLSVGDNVMRELKERAGTPAFMAIEFLGRHTPIVHEVHHDLESFYWLLIWLVLRHTNDDHHHGSSAVFRGDENLCRTHKIVFLLFETLTVRGNAPLTHLLKSLAALVMKSICWANLKTDIVRLTHAAFLQALNE
ncbi:hypothetical protein SCP_0901340 [Sparassis crispa]|uniref:Fungal-type protein kinase domain-containing protein n=1 Tax=Sparassis crispa TaxID=139825 RepID=A0A401GVK8_9APHY|nr:hypothetical protein SCP_0901340 [Sparassis crispa]GBE86255.1 hypothetical protein SCP_0901340 [Sparassis crispa]